MSKSVKFVKIVSPIALAIALAACGGGGSGADFGSNTGGSTGGGTGGETANPEDQLFTLSQIELGLTELSAGGSTGITLEVRDELGALANESLSIDLTSPCISNGTSTIVSPVVSQTGVFTSTYTSIGCEGTDVITATFETQRQTASVNVQPANLGAVEFISAEPQNILLNGMSAPGQQHTSTVTFQIKNDVGGPIANADVKFELTTGVGGITLSATEGKTDNNGFVSTILQAGSVHTSVRVRATVERDNATISSESSQLVISTGIADQNSLSLSLSELNPSAWNHDGVKVDVNMYASDRYNNPVPDGTTVAFFTELGQIEPSCQTTNGACVVEWTSSDPRDLGTLDPLYPRDNNSNNSDGITTITAVVIGEESFIDTNSNGIFDDGDQLDNISDRGEAFEDYNRNYDTDTPTDNVSNNEYDQGLEPYLDFNGNGIRDPKDGQYTGLGCAHSTLCAADNGLKHIFTSAELVMAEDNQDVTIWEGNTIIASTKPEITVNQPIRNNISYRVEVSGIRNNQVPPVGTTINASSDEADIVVGSATLGSTNRHVNDINNLSGGYFTSLRVKDSDPELSTDGFIKITVVTPRGVERTDFFAYQDDIVATPPPVGDIVAPILSLNGGATISINVGDTYTEPGGNVVDETDGVIPFSSVQIVGEVPVDGSNVATTQGTFTIFYTVEDAAGNSTQLTRTVTVNP